MKPTEIVKEGSLPNTHRVVRYDEIRCVDCDRMLFCHNWVDYGYLWTHCTKCDTYHYWKFENRPELKEYYKSVI